MFRTYVLALSLCLALGCRSSSEQPPERIPPAPTAKKPDAANLSIGVKIDDATYTVTIDLPAGRWDGPVRDEAVMAYQDEAGRHTLTFSFGHVEDFDNEVAELRAIAAEVQNSVTEPVEVVVPGRRAELRSLTTVGDPVKSRMVTLRPDETLPLGISILDRFNADDTGLDLEPTIASIRVSRK